MDIDAEMQKLPEAQRVSFVLSSFAGVPQKEIAEMLGCSVEMVKWNVFQARKNLRKGLEGSMSRERN